MTKRWQFTVLLAGVVAIVCACGNKDSKTEITETRKVAVPTAPAPEPGKMPPGHSGMGKMGQESSPEAMPPGHPDISKMPGNAPEMPPGHPDISKLQANTGNGAMTPSSMPPLPSPEFHWQLPAGWVEGQPTPMRQANFKIKDAPDADCYISVLSGKAGGVEMNANRWRSQMGLEALPDTEAAALPKITVLGKDATWVELTGTYNDKSNYCLIGAICPLRDQSVFIKMIGPEDQVKKQVASFKAFCQTLK